MSPAEARRRVLLAICEAVGGDVRRAIAFPNIADSERLTLEESELCRNDLVGSGWIVMAGASERWCTITRKGLEAVGELSNPGSLRDPPTR